MCRWSFRAAIRASACSRSTTSRSISARASSSACSARPAAARARCSTSSAACSRRPRATVTVNGTPVTSPRPNEIAYVFQESTLFPWFTVLENFRLALKFRGIEEANWRDRAMQSLVRGRHGAVRQPLSQAALRRHEAAHQSRARALRRLRGAAARRAVRRARRADPHGAGRGPLDPPCARAARPSCSSPIRSPKRCSSPTASS